MKTKILPSLLLLGILSALAGGCSWFKRSTGDYGYPRPIEFQNPKLAKHDFKVTKNSTNYFRAEYDRLVKSNQLDQARAERNAILSELMLMIDGAHGEFERDSRALKSAGDLFADLAVLGVNGAGTVTGGAEAKAILSAVAGGITGAKLAVNKDLLQEQAIEAIQAEMAAAMKQRKAEIITSMTNSVVVYPLELGLADVANYYYDGTFTRALQNLVQDAKKKEQEANAAVQKAINPNSSAANSASK